MFACFQPDAHVAAGGLPALADVQHMNGRVQTRTRVHTQQHTVFQCRTIEPGKGRGWRVAELCFVFTVQPQHFQTLGVGHGAQRLMEMTVDEHQAREPEVRRDFHGLPAIGRRLEMAGLQRTQTGIFPALVLGPGEGGFFQQGTRAFTQWCQGIIVRACIGPGQRLGLELGGQFVGGCRRRHADCSSPLIQL